MVKLTQQHGLSHDLPQGCTYESKLTKSSVYKLIMYYRKAARFGGRLLMSHVQLTNPNIFVVYGSILPFTKLLAKSFVYMSKLIKLNFSMYIYSIIDKSLTHTIHVIRKAIAVWYVHIFTSEGHECLRSFSY